MTHRKLALLLLILGNFLAGSSQAADIWQKYNKLKTLTADFSQTKELKSIGVKLKSEGTMSFDRPDFFEWKVIKPKNFVFQFKSGVIVLMEDGNVLKSADSASFDKKMLDAIAHLKAWLMIDQKFIEKHYTIKKVSGSLYDFTPKSDNKMFKGISIELGKNYPIKKITLLEVTGDAIEIEFSKTKMTYEN